MNNLLNAHFGVYMFVQLQTFEIYLDFALSVFCVLLKLVSPSNGCIIFDRIRKM